jgi:hypothetical protein
LPCTQNPVRAIGQIYQTRTHHQILRVNHPVCVKPARHYADSSYLSGSNEYISKSVCAIFRIYQMPVPDMDVHENSRIKPDCLYVAGYPEQ